MSAREIPVGAPCDTGEVIRSALPERPEARRLLIGTLLAALGQGMTLPFLFIYLHEVRHIDATAVGVVVAWMGLLGLVLAVPVGTLIDRFGARHVVLPLVLLDSLGVGSYALAHTTWQAFGSATLAAVGQSAIWPAMNTIFTTVTNEAERQRVFGLNFAILNLGIGTGGVVAGFIVDVHRVGSFQVLYVTNAIATLLPAAILLSMRSVGGPIVEQHDDAGQREHGGYRRVLADRAFRRFVLFTLVLMSCAYAQIEVGYTAFSATVADVSPRIIAWGLAANTVTIVLAQLYVLKRMEGRSRTGALAVVGVIIATSWVILGLGTLGKSVSGALPVLGVLMCAVVFACGETLMSPILPALTNALAPDELRGRYNAMASMTWGVTFVVGPLTAAPLIGHGLAGVWLGLVVGGALVASTIALSLRPLLTPAQDGRTDAEPELVSDEAPLATPTVVGVTD
jgi:MFS family permease